MAITDWTREAMILVLNSGSSSLKFGLFTHETMTKLCCWKAVPKVLGGATAACGSNRLSPRAGATGTCTGRREPTRCRSFHAYTRSRSASNLPRLGIAWCMAGRICGHVTD